MHVFLVPIPLLGLSRFNNFNPKTATELRTLPGAMAAPAELRKFKDELMPICRRAGDDLELSRYRILRQKFPAP